MPMSAASARTAPNETALQKDPAAETNQSQPINPLTDCCAHNLTGTKSPPHNLDMAGTIWILIGRPAVSNNRTTRKTAGQTRDIPRERAVSLVVMLHLNSVISGCRFRPEKGGLGNLGHNGFCQAVGGNKLGPKA